MGLGNKKTTYTYVCMQSLSTVRVTQLQVQFLGEVLKHDKSLGYGWLECSAFRLKEYVLIVDSRRESAGNQLDGHNTCMEIDWCSRWHSGAPRLP